MLEFDVFRIPVHVKQVSWRKVTNAAFAVIVGPTTGGCRTLVKQQAIFVYCFQENVLAIFVVLHVVLFVGDYKIANALCNGVIGVCDLHFESANGGVARVGGSENMPEIRIAKADVSDVVIKHSYSAVFDEFANGFSLSRRDPISWFGRSGRNRWI